MPKIQKMNCKEAEKEDGMMNEIQIFNSPDFGDVRTIMIDGEPWFVGADVTRVLGFKDNTSAMRNVDEDDKIKGCSISTPSRGVQQMTVINESGLYSLIFGSKLESAKKFKKWVTSEVLPQLRKTGSYGRSPLTTQEQIQLLAQGNVEINQRVGNLEERMDEFEQNLPLLPEDADDVSREVKKRVIEILGGKDSNAYHDKSLSQTVFKDAYRDLKRNFDVSSYKAIKRHRKGAAVELARSYQAPLYLQERIRDTNAQMTFGGGSCV